MKDSVETIEAKLRNHLTPVCNLVELIKMFSEKPDDLVQMIHRHQFLEDVEQEIDEVIKIGKLADSLIKK